MKRIAILVLMLTGCSSSADPEPPTVTGISPTSGETFGDTDVTISGTGFKVGQTTMRLGGELLFDLDVLSETTAVGFTRPHAEGVVSLQVTTPAGSATLASAFTFVPPANDTCQIVWANTGTTAGRYDIYIVDMPIEDWTTGAKSYGAGTRAVFYDELLVSSGDYAALGVADAGTFSVTVAGTDLGDSVELIDDGGQLYYDQTSAALLGSGGAATFSGVWSSDPVTPGTAGSDVTLMWMGSPLTIGSYIRYATCYYSGG